jgi:hypothetical protein
MHLPVRKNLHAEELGETLEAGLVVTALTNALMRRAPDCGLNFHFDRGSQYGRQALRKPLSVICANLSMSAQGNCYDKWESCSVLIKPETALLGRIFVSVYSGE